MKRVPVGRNANPRQVFKCTKCGLEVEGRLNPLDGKVYAYDRSGSLDDGEPPLPMVCAGCGEKEPLAPSKPSPRSRLISDAKALAEQLLRLERRQQAIDPHSALRLAEIVLELYPVTSTEET